MIQMHKIIYHKMITMHKKLKQPKIFWENCKKCSKNKKVVLQNKFVFIIKEMLQITKKIKSINVTKNVQKWPRKCPNQTVLKNKKNAK